jgi:hypothetical protein
MVSDFISSSIRICLPLCFPCSLFHVQRPTLLQTRIQVSWGYEIHTNAYIHRSSIMSEPTIFPDKYVLKLGIFPRIPAPECEAFAAHRQEWQGKHDGMVQFATARGGQKLGE